MTETLIVGGLTIDRFPDGSVSPGGSVLHAAHAARVLGANVTTLTVAGDEAASREGLERLVGIGPVIRQSAAATTVYRHGERDGARVLVLEAVGAPIEVDDFGALAAAPDVAVIAPIAGEVSPGYVARLRGAVAPRLTVLLIQGWLRRLHVGHEVAPMPLAALDAAAIDAMRTADAIVVSTEDLADVPGDPFGQAAELRAVVGPKPLVVVTLGVEGYLLDDSRADRVVASVPRTVVDGVPAVGAGDTFGVGLAIMLARGEYPQRAADAATDLVIQVLEARRG